VQVGIVNGRPFGVLGAGAGVQKPGSGLVNELNPMGCLLIGT